MNSCDCDAPFCTLHEVGMSDKSAVTRVLTKLLQERDQRIAKLEERLVEEATNRDADVTEAERTMRRVASALRHAHTKDDLEAIAEVVDEYLLRF